MRNSAAATALEVASPFDSRTVNSLPGQTATRSFYRTALSSLPLVVVGTLAATGTIALPANAAPADLQKTSDADAFDLTWFRVNPAVSAAPDTLTADVARPSPATPAVKTTVSGVTHQYVVSAGDTVSGIADRLGLSTSAILKLNGLNPDSVIYPNQTLRLTSGSSAASSTPSSKHSTSQASAANGTSHHIVVAGDTVSGIADRFGLSTSKLLALNGLKSTSTIFPNQVIRLSAKASATSASSGSSGSSTATKPASVSGATVLVSSGDTMTAIAQQAGVTLKALLTRNSLSMGSIIYPGQVIVIPHPKAAADSDSSTGTGAASTPEAPAHIEMNAETRGNAETIIRVGRQAGASDYGIVIALVAAMQESGLRNLDHGDRDSLGLFQQRSSTGWGTVDQVRDVEYASLAFFGGAGNPNPGITRGLLDIPDWKNMTVSEAAQAVQISGFPNYYAKWEAIAQSWLNELG